jgi:hypothetical protein
MHNIKYLPNKKMDKLFQKGLPVLSYTAKSKTQLDMIKNTYTNAVFEGFIPK